MFPTFNFFGLFASKKAEAAAGSIVSLLVRFDPETASEAQIDEFEQQLDLLTGNVARVRTDFLREKSEADEIAGKYKQLVKAAEHLEASINNPANEAKKAELEVSLGKLVADLEKMLPDVDREKQEADEAAQNLHEYELAAEQAAEKLKTARVKLTSARREVEKTELRKDRAQESAEQAAVLAGLRQQNDSMGIVLNTMNAQAQKNREETDALELKAKLLRKGGDGTVESDPNVAAALAAVEAKPKVSLADRLGALKNRTASPTK